MNFKHGDIINIHPTRKVLFEKYASYISAEEFFASVMNGCVVEMYKNQLENFNLKKDGIKTFSIMLYNKSIWVNGYQVWYKLYPFFKTTHNPNDEFFSRQKREYLDVQNFIQKQFEKYFGFENFNAMID